MHLNAIKACLIRDFLVEKRYLLASLIIVAAVTAIELWSSASFFEHQIEYQELLSEQAPGMEVVLLDAFAYLFKGAPAPVPDAPFLIPLGWITLQLALISAVALYPAIDQRNLSSIQILLRSGKTNWLISKIIWALACLLGAFVTCYLVSLVFQTAVLPFVDWGEIYGSSVFEFLLVAILASISLAFLTMALSVVISPAMGILATSIYLILSAYFCSPILLGNYTMIDRTNADALVVPSLPVCLAVCVAMICVSVAAVRLYMHYRDLMPPKLN